MGYNFSSWLGASSICAKTYFCNCYCTCPGTSTPPMRNTGLKVEIIYDNWEDLVSIGFTPVQLIRLLCLSQAPASQCCKGTRQILASHTHLASHGSPRGVSATVGSRQAAILQVTYSKAGAALPSHGYSATCQRSWMWVCSGDGSSRKGTSWIVSICHFLLSQFLLWRTRISYLSVLLERKRQKKALSPFK